VILQSDPQWATARVGHVTASRIADLMAKTKTGWGASRANYAAQLVAERLTGNASESYSNAAMQWGVETEPHARAAYEFRTDATCGEAAFLKHPKIEWAGASPDGFVGDDGLVEFKCPNTATHIDTLLGAKVPEKYVLQMQWQLACTGRAWCDFVSFDPRLPEEMRMFLRRVDRDNTLIGTLEREVEVFLAEIDDTLKQLRRQYAEAA
jgi:putative phage-type endonuclease